MDVRQLWAICLFLFFSCTNRSQNDPEPLAPVPGVWAQYKVWAEEGDSLVTCMLQFYNRPQGRQTLILEPPARIQVDGQELEVDSAGITGAFYEYRAYLDEFSGKHLVKFTNQDGRSFIDSFSFYPFTLASELPAGLRRQNQEIAIDGLPDGSQVRVVLTDTAFHSQGINEVETVYNGKLLLPAAYLQSLKNGPVILQLIFEEDRRLRSRLEGELSVSYGLTRMFELRK
jgi:hypothetical protein